jgi:hypothetical protein
MATALLPHAQLTPYGQTWPGYSNAVHGWVSGLPSWREAQGMEGGEDNEDSRLRGEAFARTGAQIAGRRMSGFSHPHRGDNPPSRCPVFVVTHRPAEPVIKQGGATYASAATGLADAASQARAAAGDKDVLIAG